MLSDQQFMRYQRQVALPQIGEAGQQRLLNSQVLIIGCGGLGSAAAQFLAAAGVARLVIADDDQVALSNLHRQLAYRVQDVGQPKVRALARSLQALNPDCQVRTVERYMDATLLNLEVGLADVVLDCSDNLPTRHQVNRACHQAGVCLISGSAIGWEGQLIPLDFTQRPQGCYQCVVPEQESAAALRCSDMGVAGPVVGTIGNLQALLAVQKLIQLEEFHSHYMQRFDALSMQWQKWQLIADPHCLQCGCGKE